MKKCFMLAVTSVILFTTFALAAPPDDQQAVFTTDLKHVMATKLPSHITAPPKEDAGLKIIAGNFSRYPDATYFSIWGNTIAQGGSNFPFQTWVAVAFTPTANATVTRLEVSAGRQGGGTAGYELGIYSDDNGLPGNLIKGAHVSNISQYGECCEFASLSDPVGVPVTAGTQYWVAVTTTPEDTDIYAWAYNSTNMTPQLAASWCQGSSTYCGSDSGKWVSLQYVQFGFQVLGHER